MDKCTTHSSITEIMLKTVLFTNKGRNKKTNEQMHGRSTGSGPDLNLDHPHESPVL